METGATAVVGRGLVEILPDFRKWGAQLAGDMKIAGQQIRGQMRVPEGAVRDSMGRLRDANGRFIRDYQNGWKGAANTIGKSMAKIGKGTAALGVGVAAVSVKMAADFQSETAVLQTAAGETTKGLAVVREGIKNIAVGTGTGLKNLTDGMYTIEKAGFRGKEGLDVLRAAAQGAREENAKLSDVTNAMTSVMASYHLSAKDSVRVMNAMKTAAGEGKITMEEFSGALSTVLPIASANHIAFEDIAGSMATLTQHGTSAREATHELAATIRALASPNNVASREMARFGLSAVDVSSKLGQRGLSGTVNMLVETILSRMGPAGTRLQKIFEGTKQSGQDVQVMLKNMTGGQKSLAEEYLKGDMVLGDWNKAMKTMPVASQPALRNFKVLVDRNRGFSRELKNGGPAVQTFTDALKKMSGGAIGLNTILQITGESAAGNAERIKKVGESFHNSSKDVEGWKTTSKLLSVQMDRVKAQVQVLAIDIGTKLIPVVSAVVGFFAQHRSILLAVAVATGTFLAATSAVYVGMKLYAAYTRAAAAATAVWNFAMQMGTKYALGTRIQLGLLWAQERLMAVWSKIAAAGQWALNVAMDANPIGLIVLAIAALVAGIVWLATKTQFFQKLWGAVWGTIRKPVMAFVGWFKKNWQLITFTIMTLGIGLAVAEIVRHWNGVKHAFSATIDWVKQHWPLLLGILTGPIGLAVWAINHYWSSIVGGAKAAYHGTVGWFVSLGKDIGGFFSKLPGQIARFFTGAVGAVAQWNKDASDAIGGFFSKLPGRMAGWGKAFYQANLDAGKNLVAGLIDGATAFFTQALPGFFKTLWSGLVDYFKAVFGIHSPSVVWSLLGVNLMKGLFSGILSVASGIVNFLDVHVVSPIRSFFRAVIPAAASWMSRQVVAAWNTEYAGILAVWTLLHKYVISPLGTFFTKTIPSWASTLKSMVTSRWYALRDGVAGAYGSIHDRVFAPLGSFFTKIIPGWASTLRSMVAGRWGALRDSVAGVYDSLKTRVFSSMGNFFTRTIPGWASTMKSKVTGFFSGMRDGIGTIWAGIRDKTRAPVNWVLSHVWNTGLVSVWKKITGWIGIANKLSPVKLLAAGGTVGGAPMGVFNRATAIVGEGNPSHPEFVIPTDPKYRARALALYQQAGAHFYAGGGILGTIGDAISSAAGKAINLGKSALGFLTDPVGKAKKMMSAPLNAMASHLGSADWERMIEKLPHLAVDGLLKAVKSIGSSVLGAIGLGSSGGSGVQRWSGVVKAVLAQVGQPQSLLGITLKRMNQESGGNPTIVNTTDSNWQAGHPSVGLMQVIKGTFERYAGPYRNTGPFKYGVSVNPAANIYSSMKYALAAYGSLASAYGRAGGYRLGTMGSSSGWHWLGEDGPELAKLPAGTKIRSARASARTQPATPSVVHLTVENHGVIGSRQEVLNWLVGSLDTLERQRRLPKALGGGA